VANGLKFKGKIWGSEKVSEMVKGKEIKAKVKGWSLLRTLSSVPSDFAVLIHPPTVGRLAFPNKGQII
jgi:hypothetical protein